MVVGHSVWSKSCFGVSAENKEIGGKTSLLVRQIVSWPRGLLHLSKQGELAKVFDNFYTEIYLDIAHSHPFELPP